MTPDEYTAYFEILQGALMISRNTRRRSHVVCPPFFRTPHIPLYLIHSALPHTLPKIALRLADGENGP